MRFAEFFSRADESVLENILTGSTIRILAALEAAHGRGPTRGRTAKHMSKQHKIHSTLIPATAWGPLSSPGGGALGGDGTGRQGRA